MVFKAQTILRIFLTTTLVFFSAHAIAGQARCLSQDDVKNMLAQVKSRQNLPLNKDLMKELLRLKEKDQQRLNEDIVDRKPDAVIDRLKTAREKNASAVCRILKQYGWPTSNMVGKEGVSAALFLLRNSSSFQLQVDLLPVIVAAAKQGEVSRPAFASYLDRMRLSAGLKQLFGTQATIINGFLVLFPIETEAQVDTRRKQFELPPLGEYLRYLEQMYQLPLIRSTGELTNSFSDSVKSTIAKTTTTDLFDGQAVEEGEVLRVDTNLVSLNVSVYSTKLRTHVSTLEQKDFAVSEDGHDEPITFFATTAIPFDLVLLIDLSGSTAGKRNLIRKSTQRFIEAARPSDRVAIVTFTDVAKIVSPLTEDRRKLLESVSRIEGKGGSSVWDALKFTLDQVIGPKTLTRRRAVVFMTDGIDNALELSKGGSIINFADLVEAVRRSDTLIIPIYLDTQGDSYYDVRIYENAQKTLALLADESGGLYYRARKIEDLDGVYAQVIEDLGKVYSLGYKPANEKRNGWWRSVKVQIPNHPELVARTRPGYYAN